MLFFKIDRELWSFMKTFIVFLGKLPEYPKCYIHDIEMDDMCVKELQKVFDGKEKS